MNDFDPPGEAGLWTGAVIASAASHVGLAVALLAYQPSLVRTAATPSSEQASVSIVLSAPIGSSSVMVSPTVSMQEETASTPPVEPVAMNSGTVEDVQSDNFAETIEPEGGVDVEPQTALGPDEVDSGALQADVEPGTEAIDPEGGGAEGEALTDEGSSESEIAAAPPDAPDPAEDIQSDTEDPDTVAPESQLGVADAPLDEDVDAAMAAEEVASADTPPELPTGSAEPAETATNDGTTSAVVIEPGLPGSDFAEGGASINRGVDNPPVTEIISSNPNLGETAASRLEGQATTDELGLVAPEADTETLDVIDPEGDVDVVPPTTDDGIDVASALPQPEAPSSADPGPSDVSDGSPAGQPTSPAQDVLLDRLASRVVQTPSPACTIGQPRRVGRDEVALALFGRSDTAMTEFAAETLGSDFQGVTHSRELVDIRQCPALDYLASNADYPLSRLGLGLDAPVVESNGVLGGLITGVAGKFVTVLLVDDNGVVQSLDPFVRVVGNFARFDVPVQRDGGARETRQIVLAIATDEPATQILDRVGRLAEEVFLNLPPSLSMDAATAVATVDIR